MSNLADSYADAKRWTDAIALRQEALNLTRKRPGAEHPDIPNLLNKLAATYLEAQRWAEAEAISRECLKVREGKNPDDWLCFYTKSQVGAALAGQKKYADAEPLLIEAYDGLKIREPKLPAALKKALSITAARIVPFYEAWGKADKAAEWRAKLKPPAGAASPNR